MNNSSKNSKWILQGWQDNPKDDIMKGLEPG